MGSTTSDAMCILYLLCAIPKADSTGLTRLDCERTRGGVRQSNMNRQSVWCKGSSYWSFSWPSSCTCPEFFTSSSLLEFWRCRCCYNLLDSSAALHVWRKHTFHFLYINCKWVSRFPSLNESHEFLCSIMPGMTELPFFGANVSSHSNFVKKGYTIYLVCVYLSTYKIHTEYTCAYAGVPGSWIHELFPKSLNFPSFSSEVALWQGWKERGRHGQWGTGTRRRSWLWFHYGNHRHLLVECESNLCHLSRGEPDLRSVSQAEMDGGWLIQVEIGEHWIIQWIPGGWFEKGWCFCCLSYSLIKMTMVNLRSGCTPISQVMRPCL